MKTIVRIVVKTVRNVSVSTFVVCFLAFLCFIGKPETNNVVAQEQKNVQSPTITRNLVTLDRELPKPLTQEQLEAIAIQPATKYEETGSRVVPAMLPLFREESITYTGKEKYNNTVLKFRLHVPENIEQGKKYPLILWLHGAGEVGEDNKLQLIHLHHIITYLTGEKKRDFFLLVPQAPQQHGTWDAHSYTRQFPVPENLAKQLKDPKMRDNILKQYESAFGSEMKTSVSVTEIDGETVLTASEPFEDSPLGFSFAMLDQVIQNYPVDTDRITVSGLSTGGDGTWRALERRPELFAAAVPLVSWRALTDVELQKSPVLKKIPIWAIYSSDDNGIDQARTDFERVEKAGCNVKKSEFGICGHNAWTPAMLQADIFSWLLSRAKKDGEYIAVADSNVNPDDLKGIVEVATRDPGKPKLAPAPPQTVQQTTKETAKNETKTVADPFKPAAAFSVQEAQQQPNSANSIIRAYRDSHGNVVKETLEVTKREIVSHPQQNVAVTRPDSHPPQRVSVVAENAAIVDKERLYYQAAIHYFLLSDGFEGFSRAFSKLSLLGKKNLIEKILAHSDPIFKEFVYSREQLEILERLIDQLPPTVPISQNVLQQPRREQTIRSSQQVPIETLQPHQDLRSVPAEELPSPYYMHKRVEYFPQEKTVESSQFTAQRGGDEEVTVTGKVIEDCDRPWAMTSDSLYGMFPADWNKEAQKIPEFIVELDSDKLAKKLAASVSGDGNDFTAACQSILTLENKPMSSPWFETGGGRLRSDIRYTLSAKGQMFVRLLKTVKDSTGNNEKNNRAKLAQKTLEKIELILE